VLRSPSARSVPSEDAPRSDYALPSQRAEVPFPGASAGAWNRGELCASRCLISGSSAGSRGRELRDATLAISQEGSRGRSRWPSIVALGSHPTKPERVAVSLRNRVDSVHLSGFDDMFDVRLIQDGRREQVAQMLTGNEPRARVRRIDGGTGPRD
jgi:hypothetical protein